jgi:putative flippase GtrA
MRQLETLLNLEAVRYAVNGLMATAVHFGVLQLNLNILSISSVGVANFIAALFGVFFSFVGNRYFVFKSQKKSSMSQVFRFGGLYATIAILHGIVLFWWCDLQGWDYRSGFVVATTLQIVSSYLGNKMYVFIR